MKKNLTNKNTKNCKNMGTNRYTKMVRNIEQVEESKRKAMSVFYALLDTGISKEYFTSHVKYLNKEYYEDVSTERALSGVCGYPLCDNSFVYEQKQQFIIRNNRVYDITKRSYFCSGQCYEASVIIAEQIPSTPLYLRSTDHDLEVFSVKIPELSQLKGLYGDLINVTGNLTNEDLKSDTKKVQIDVEQNNYSNSEDDDESKASLEESGVMNKNKRKGKCKTSPNLNSESGISDSGESLSVSGKGCLLSDRRRTDKCDLNHTETHSDAEIKRNEGEMNIHPENDAKLVNRLSGMDICEDGLKKPYPENVSRPETSIVRESKRRIASNHDSLKHIYEVEKFLREWMSFESLRLILGDTYLKGMLEDLGKKMEDVDDSSVSLNVEWKEKYVALCKKLDASEAHDQAMEAGMVSSVDCPRSEVDAESDLQPVPKYDQLKEDVKNMSLKVEAFYRGTEQISDLKQNDQESSEEISLPLIDNCSQMAWRRQIVLDRLKKPFSLSVAELGLDCSELWRILTGLVSTFRLSPNNINLTVRQWQFVSLVMLKMISVRYPIVQQSMGSEGRGHRYMSDFLKKESLDEDYFNRLLSFLTEISYVLSKSRWNDGVPDKPDSKQPSLNFVNRDQAPEIVDNQNKFVTFPNEDTKTVKESSKHIAASCTIAENSGKLSSITEELD